MRLTVLGSRGGYPTENSACSSYLLQTDTATFLFDMGTGSLRNLIKTIEIDKIDAVFISHLHFDHISDLLDFQYLIQMQRGDGIIHKNMKVFLPKEPEGIYSVLKNSKEFDLFEINDGMEVRIEGVNVRVKRTSHPVPSYAFRVAAEGKSFVYTGDASASTPDFDDILKDADLAVMDCGNLEKYMKPTLAHMTPAQCFELCRRNNIKSCVLSHLIPHYSEEDYSAETKIFDQVNYVMAADGLIINI